MNIIYCSAEVEPFAKSGGLGDVMGALPKAVAAEGHRVRVVMPRYTKVIPQEYKEKMKYIGYFYTDLAWRHQYCGVFTFDSDGVSYYFLDNEYYFGGDLYCFADIERFSFFAKACLDLTGWLGEKPDVIHCNDWSTGLLPVLFDAFYRPVDFYKNIKLVYTVHNLRYQGITSVGNAEDLTALPHYFFTGDRLVQNNCVNYMKGAIVFSDAVTTVSPTYAEEIKTDAYSECLGDVINKYSYKIRGILNGVDYGVYNPAKDRTIAATYSAASMAGKTVNKLALQKRLGLPEREDVPVIGLISRLVDQKGLDLVNAVIEDVLQHDVQFVVLGTGEKKYEDMFTSCQQRHPDKVSANIYFSNVLAHQIYAGADFVLVPSLFEPCGLTQIIGLKYGAVPIVRETGGLKDTVTSYNEQTGCGNGFSFAAYNAGDMLYTICRALDFWYTKKDLFRQIRKTGMKCDFGWKESSRKYIQMYGELTGLPVETESSPSKKPTAKRSASKKTKQ